LFSEIFAGVYRSTENGILATLNLASGNVVYGERLFKENDNELREWNPERSKLAASVLKGLKRFPIRQGSKVLYLGAATGTTVSHVSDIVGNEGIVFSVEISFRSIKQLISRVAEKRGNIVPILADASHPERYKHLSLNTDVLYCDIAQPDQTEIMLRNADFYLSDGGYVMMIIKASSIDSVKSPKLVFESEIAKMTSKIEISEIIDLQPFALYHEMIVGKIRR
jgi:fibrillarin-like pre-rRNA processing protein